MPKKVFIADDNKIFTTQIKSILEKYGFEVLVSESFKESEEIIERIKPDMAIIDLIGGNDDSGFVLSYRMKKKYPDVPVIIATTLSAEAGISFNLDSEAERKWIKADVYLEKGLTPDQVLKVVLQLLKI